MSSSLCIRLSGVGSTGKQPFRAAIWRVIHKLIKGEHELDTLYEEHRGKYKALKEALVEDLDTFITPLRERYHELASDPRAVEDALEKGGQLARERANAKIEEVRRAIGVS